MITLKPAKEEQPDKAGTRLFDDQTKQAKTVAEAAKTSVGAAVEEKMELFANICEQFLDVSKSAGVTVAPKPQEEAPKPTGGAAPAA